MKSAADLLNAPQPTQSFDDMGQPGEDARFGQMEKLNKYLEETFPLTRVSLSLLGIIEELTPLFRRHTAVQLEKVALYGLLYTWKGSDESLKPIVRRNLVSCSLHSC